MRKLLLLRNPARSAVDAAQVEPFARHAAALGAAYGLRVEIAPAPARLVEHVADAAPDWLFLQGRALRAEPREQMRATLRELRRRVERVVWLDCQASSLREDFWAALEVDLTVRRSLVRWRGHYGRACLHGRLHAEAVRRYCDPRRARALRMLALAAGARPALALSSVARIWRAGLRPGRLLRSGVMFPERSEAVALGWNLALGEGLGQLAAAAGPDAVLRDLDLHCRVRASFPRAPAWYVVDRLSAVRAAGRLADRWRVLATTAKLEYGAFLGELRRARLAVSPFGWGEICTRDFEAILCGCLLVKPSMRHVETWPDVFLPFETYLPVRWDWSDLETVCRPYIEDEQLRRRVADNARERLLGCLGESAFLSRFGEIHDRLSAPRAASIPQ